MERKQKVCYHGYLGVLLGFLLFFVIVVMNGCTIYRLKIPQSDGTVVSAFIMYPPGKKVNLSNLEFGKFKLGSAEGKQPGPSDYAKASADIIDALLYKQAQETEDN